MKNQSGQTLLILLLSTLVALTIGLAITQRTLTDVSTSTKGEQSSRAYSAAEAGIQKIYNSTDPTNLTLQSNYVTSAELGNLASADVAATGLIPQYLTLVNQPGLEYPPIDKTSFAQFWLADPSNVSNWLKTAGTTALTTAYHQPAIDLYFGNSDDAGVDRPAIEATVISYNSTTKTFSSTRSYWDSYARGNNFSNLSCNLGSLYTASTYNINSTLNAAGKLDPQASQFFCHTALTLDNSAGVIPVLVRMRILYADSAQKIALVPTIGCINPDCALPPQAVIYYSKGKSGQSQRQLKLFTLKNAAPYTFDFSLFSVGNITK